MSFNWLSGVRPLVAQPGGVAPAERLFDAKVLQAGERNGATLDELWPDIAALL